MSFTESEPVNNSLDPRDWGKFRQAAHELLDRCIDYLSSAEDHPWRPVPVEVVERYRVSDEPCSIVELIRKLADDVLPYATGNTHPAFFGWVHGSGLASGLLSELVAATMNSNCGGRDHGMSYVERAVIDWAKDVFGFPVSSSGLLVAGTSQATVLALAAARVKALGSGVRQTGQRTQWLTAYAGESVHNSANKAVELLGIGRENLRAVPESEEGMDVELLAQWINEDRDAGAIPFAIVATAGSVDFGRFDKINDLASLAEEEGLWLHVDGAFGAWLRLASQPWRSLVDGIDRADSIACDFHKWMYVQYDCGLCLMRDEAIHRAAFASRPPYLASQRSGLGGGDPWYCDYGIDLSRGNRALKVWAALQHYGRSRLGWMISENCRHAVYLGNKLTNHPRMEVVAPVVSNVCVFTADASLSESDQSALNEDIASKLQLEGIAVFSTTAVNGIQCLRAAITNHRTCRATIDRAVAALERCLDEAGVR
jgi:glutamate/tyrosine decarboxylase-like PLP-dependent enzyme